MKKQTSFVTLSLMLATPALAGGAGAPVSAPASGPCRTIAQIVMSDPNFSTLATAVEAAGLSQTLMGGQYTVFAPTNAAFAKLPSDTLAMVLNDATMLRNILLYHVVAGKVSSKQVMGMSSGKTLQGSSFLVSKMGNRVMVDNATVTRADVAACNGVVHVIDTVLMPAMSTAAAPAPAPAPAATTPAPAPAPAATAPVTTAPAAVDVLRIPATPVSVGASTTVTTNTSTNTSTTTTTTTTTEVSTTTLYDLISGDERFTTLRDLLSDAELTEVLISNEYTVFAPTNEAFEAVDPDTLALIASDPETLKAVLLYHVVSGRLESARLTQAGQLRSEQGASLDVTLNGTNSMIGEAMVTTTPIQASNGFIYPVSAVLLPPDLVLPQPPTGDTATTDTTTSTTTTTTTTSTTITLTSAQSGANLLEVLSQPQFSTLLSLVQRANLLPSLTAADVTIFAPTNEAFAKVPQATLDMLLADPAKLTQVLQYHVVTGRVIDQGLNVAQLRSVEGSSIDLMMDGSGGVRAGVRSGDTITGGLVSTRADAGTSVVYAIDTVLMPPSMR
ncbi:fasciclin domain-containing protein [Deinococcus arcticus]|uniref:Fasciclin n=1 Tax=Deinococcus arcticus TaxID=2136176 RepID=A0A2T3WCN2_9DEIO|nr:fasciclin domain-containing protein [Deinococcus arcticus]PTA69659.1 fasciclin [Deinococcus arcticus]